jgi:hypothetical protein
MQNEPEVGMLDERKEAKRAVAHPLHHHTVTPTANHGLDERGPLPQHVHLEPAFRQEPQIGCPRGGECFAGVMKEVDVAGGAGRANQLVQRDAPSDIALALGYPILRDEAAEASLELRESQCLSSLARTYVARFPCRSIHGNTCTASSNVVGR